MCPFDLTMLGFLMKSLLKLRIYAQLRPDTQIRLNVPVIDTYNHFFTFCSDSSPKAWVNNYDYR